MNVNLRLTMRQRLLGLLESVKADKKLVVVDEQSLQVIDAVLTLSDILDCGVFLVEFLAKKRQPYPTMDAIYVFSPDNKASVDHLLGDFDCPNPMYQNVHLFAINDISSEQFSRLTACPPLAQRVRTVQQVYADFLAVEARCFHFGRSALSVLFPSTTGNMSAQLVTELDRMARRLLSVWVALGEYPIIRYHRSEDDVLAARLASLLQEYLKSHAERLHISQAASTSASELIIMSRSLDLMTPLLHDFTYQAMAADLVGIQRTSGDKSSRESSGQLTFSPDRGKTMRILDEGDILWEALRHTHIAKCGGAICQKFNDFISENKAARKVAAASKQGTAEGTTTDLDDLKGLLNEMGEFQDLKSMFGLHLSLANECLRVMNEKHLMDVAVVEQNLATGRNGAGDLCKAASQWPPLLDLLTKPFMTTLDKIRLASLYALVTGNVETGALERAGLSSQDLALVTKIRDLGHRAALKRLPQPKSKFQPESEYDVSRHHPTVKYILEAAQLNNLDANEYPRADPVMGSGSSNGTKPIAASSGGGGVSLRGSSATSAGPGTGTTGTTSTTNKPKIVMAFVIGGLSHAEIKVAYDNTVQGANVPSKCQVIIGSTHIAPPEAFLNNLRELVGSENNK